MTMKPSEGVGLNASDARAASPGGVTFDLNGAAFAFDGDPRTPLLWVLRDEAGLLGAKFGCGHGACGACIVHVDGRAVAACATEAGDLDGRSVTTIEGLIAARPGDPVRAAFVARDVPQCGYCTPGLVMAVSAALAREPRPSLTELELELLNLCPCASFHRVRLALRDALGGSPAPSRAAALPLVAEPEIDPRETSIWHDIGPWVRVADDGRTTVHLSQTEIGQGSYTGLTQIVADELGADWSRVRVVMAPGGAPYKMELLGYKGQFTGGSLSTNLWAERLSQAGANARHCLEQAGALRWNVASAECRAVDGRILHVPTGRSLDFGEVAAVAAAMPYPDQAPRRPPAERTLVGRRVARLDTAAKVDGTARFGTDVDLPGLLHGAPAFAPAFGASIVSVDDAVARAMPGVVAVVPIDGGGQAPSGVIVVAKTWWQAAAAAEHVRLTVELPAEARFSSIDIADRTAAAIDADVAVVARQDGEEPAPSVLGRSDAVIERAYSVPYIAHATLEPPVATAMVGDGEATIWAPVQGQDVVRDRIQAAFGIAEDRVTVRTTFAGGGFGRKFFPDFCVQAAMASKAVGGRPVKLMWTREADLRHDRYRPAIAARLRACLDGEGRPAALHARVVGQGLLAQIFPIWMKDGVDEATVEGTRDLPYAIPCLTVDTAGVEAGVPLGFLRSVGRFGNVFFVESFIDELAEAAGQDPYRYRRSLLEADPRGLAVLDAVAGMAGWDSRALPPGRALGIAYGPYGGRGETYVTPCAQVAEVSVGDDGLPRVHKVWCAIDPGTAVNPDIVEAQCEGAIGFALSAALRSRITFHEGAVVESSFDDYPLLRLHEMPEVEVRIVESGGVPTGVGEAAVPPLAPAVASAMAKLTGRRTRHLPFAGRSPENAPSGDRPVPDRRGMDASFVGERP